MLVAVLVLSGCTTTKIDKPVTGEEAVAFARNGPEPGYGILVGSFAYSGHHPSSMAKMLGSGDFRYNRYGFLFRSLEEGRSDFIGDIGSAGTFMSNSYELDFELDEGGGYVFAIPLLPGEYAFYQFHLFQNAAYIQNTWGAREPFHMPFTIEEGTATYIGEVRALHRFAKNTFGMYIPGGGYFVFDDSSERDLDLLKEKFSFLSDYPMRHAPLTNPDLPQPEEPEQSDSGQQEG